MKFPTVFCQKV